MRHRIISVLSALVVTAALGMLVHASSRVVSSSEVFRPSADGTYFFHVGEEAVYDIYWGIFHVATTRVTTEWVEEEGASKRIRIRFRTRSNSFIEHFYPVDDVIESLIEADTFLPVYFMKKQKEGRYRSDELTTFDFEALTMNWESRLNGNRNTFDIESDTRDIVSAMYWFRALDYDAGDEFAMRVMADEKLYDLHVKVAGRDDVTLKEYGTVPCLRFEPQAAFQGLFVRKGKITFWVSDDDRKICTKIKAKVPVASIELKLREVSGPGTDRWIVMSPANRPKATEMDTDAVLRR